MAEDVSAPAAEPSTAPEAKSAPPADAIESVAVPTDPEAYAEWRQTGKLPENNGRKPPKREDSATSAKKPSVDSQELESDPVSETGSPAGKRSAQKRIDQLTAEKESFRRELEELKAKQQGKQDAKAPESSSVPAPAGSSEPKAPEQEDFKTWDEYRAAEKKYVRDLAAWMAKQQIEEHLQKMRQEAAESAMQTRLDEAKSRYGAEAESKIMATATSVFEDKEIPRDIKLAIGSSEVFIDALYYLSTDAGDLASFVALAKKAPLKALRKWFTVEDLITKELGKSKPEPEETPPAAAPRAPDGKFLPAKKSPPAPPTELNGSSSPPGDERDRAASTGNVRAFFAEGNRRDAQRWKGNY